MGLKAVVNDNECVGCGCCVKACPITAVEIFNGRYAVIDYEKCVGCGKCGLECPASVINIMKAEVTNY